MPYATPIALAARERLREHHAAAAKSVADHAAALARLDAATSRRAEVVARQDALVADAATEVWRVPSSSATCGERSAQWIPRIALMTADFGMIPVRRSLSAETGPKYPRGSCCGWSWSVR